MNHPSGQPAFFYRDGFPHNARDRCTAFDGEADFKTVCRFVIKEKSHAVRGEQAKHLLPDAGKQGIGDQDTAHCQRSFIKPDKSQRLFLRLFKQAGVINGHRCLVRQGLGDIRLRISVRPHLASIQGQNAKDFSRASSGRPIQPRT